ncbi:hypothetical protein ABFP60_12705 [Clostridioides difficile]
MKKLLVLALTALTITALVGCGAKNEQDNNVESSNSNKNNIVEANESTSQNEMLFAKVKRVVGNEISVKLSDEEFDMEGGMELGAPLESYELDESQMAALEAGGTVDLGNGVMGTASIDQEASEDYDPSEGAVIADPAQGMEDGGAVADGGISFSYDGDLDGSSMFAETEFNGEDKDFIIPAGVEIFNMITGKLGNISDIKEGSIIFIGIDSKTNKVISIEILE